jgi:hypothetical protein
MSNTSTVTPYDSVGTAVSSSAIGALAGACVAVSNWLMEETPEDRAAVEARRAERRRELLGLDLPKPELTLPLCEPLQLHTAHLHQREMEPLLRAAEKLGYRREPLTGLGGQAVEQPLLLRGARGERLAVTRNRKGALDISTRGTQDPIQALVRQHTVDRAVEHLSATGQVQSHVLPNGEVQLQARESNMGQPGGQAVISVQIHQDGSLWADVDQIRGRRCKELVDKLAQAVGGEVVESVQKEAFYQLPGEPTKTRLQL